MREHDAMYCRSCGHEERASEGYPCDTCSTFICVVCALKGITRCRRCAGGAAIGDDEEILRVIESLSPESEE